MQGYKGAGCRCARVQERRFVGVQMSRYVGAQRSTGARVQCSLFFCCIFINDLMNCSTKFQFLMYADKTQHVSICS